MKDCSLNIDEIMEYLEITPPFLMIDYVERLIPGKSCYAIKRLNKDDWFFKIILIALINKFMQTFPSYRRQVHIFTEGVPYCLAPFWVNFQKENEFNPLHNHGGVFSFVIWVKIPTDWREQHALPFSANSHTPKASNFEFQYTTMLGDIGRHTYCLDKKSEGQMLFFPAKLMHTVYPFYNCDKERISISGNIRLDTSTSNL